MEPSDEARIEELRVKAARLKIEGQAARDRKDLVEAARIVREDKEITQELQRLARKYGL